MTTVFRWKNILTVFIRHFALALSRAESMSALLSASRNHLPRVTRRCPDGIPRCGNRRRRRRNFSEDSRDRVTFDPLSPRHATGTSDRDATGTPILIKSREILPIRFPPSCSPTFEYTSYIQVDLFAVVCLIELSDC